MPDFAYINARVRAMRSRLLEAGRMEELLGTPSFGAFLQALGATPYGLALQEALARRSGIQAVDEALARNFSATTQKIRSFGDGKSKALIETLLLRWDLANVRAVLRGKHTGRSEQEIMASVMPAGLLTEVALRELARQPDIPAVAGTLEALEHPFALPVAEGLRDYLQDQDLLALEMHVERYYAEHVLAVARGGGHNETVLRELVQAEIDSLNVKTAVKLVRLEEPLPAADRRRFFVPGGAIVTDDIFLLLSEPETAPQGWRALGAHGFPLDAPQGDLTEFEKTLDLLLTRGTARLYLGDPLGIEIVVGYLALKYNEVVNLRLIARSKQLGIPRDLVRREMVVV
jgi:V/A-type H+-transporting ATPase subunit C